MKNKTNAYEFLAEYYEDLAEKDGYAKWAEYVVSTVKEFSTGKSGVDLACGSGYFTRALKRSGFNVFGADLSREMLVQAEKRSLKEGLVIEYRLLNLVNFKSFEKLDFATVINDGFNYLDRDSLKKSFSAIGKSLKKGGAFIFDISSEYKIKNILGNNVFAEDYDDMTYLWFNELCGDKVKMSLTFFIREGDKYIRRDETHLQYAHSVDFIKKTLEETGFTLKRLSGALGEKLTDKSERCVFVADKNPN